jgi:hypothetical protein
MSHKIKMKAYSIVLWLLLFNAVLGMMSTMDLFGASDTNVSNPLKGILPNADNDLNEKINKCMEIVANPYGDGGFFGLVASWLTFAWLALSWLGEFLLLSVTFLPSLLTYFIPELGGFITVITLAVYVVAAIGLIQMITGKWFGFAT